MLNSDSFVRAIRKHRRALWTCSCAALAASVTSVPAVAQTAAATPNNSALEEIVVTAQKRSENLQNVPIAVAAFSADTLKSANITSVANLVNVTPSLRFHFGGPGGSIFLRGVGNSQQFAGAESEVQTYVDGVYYGSGGAAYLKLNNVERIEVDKGPQGTLFGRNATGGVIQIITRDPTQDPRLDASVGYGNYDAKQADLYASGGIAHGVAADIAVHYEDHDGWGRNLFLNKDAFSARSVSVRSKWRFDLSEKFHATFIADYGRDRSDLGVAYVLREAPWRASLADPIPTIPPPYTINDDFRERAIVKRYDASLKLDAELGDLTGVSITGVRYTHSNGTIDADGTPTPYAAGDETRKETQVSQEFQLLSSSGSRFKWILGTYLYYNKGKADPAYLSGILLARFGASAVDSVSDVITHSAAAFGQATYDLTDSTHITGGLRFTYDHRRQNAMNTLLGPNGPVPPPPFLILNQNNYPTANFSALTGKITVAQDLSRDAMVYATYSRGFKSGTFNNFQVLSSTAPALKPEFIDAFEGGLKSTLLDGKLRFNLAAFYYKYTNLQVNEFVAVPVPSIVLRNAAAADIKGLEGDTQLALAKNTRLTGGFGYLDAKYKKFPNAPLYIVNPITSPNGGPPPFNTGYGGIVNSVTDAKGNRLPQAPRFSGYVGINQGVDLGQSKLDLNATVSYQSRVYFTPDNQYSQAPAALISASAKWTAPNGKWDLTIWGRNLNDKKTVSDVTISFRGVAGVPDEPLTYGARVGVHF